MRWLLHLSMLLLTVSLAVSVTPSTRAQTLTPPPSSAYDPSAAPPSPEPLAPLATTSPIPCTGHEDILLIQDNVPWVAGTGQDPLGATVTELKARNASFCMIGSADIGTTTLSHYKNIIISSGQNQMFYNNLFPSGAVHPSLTTYVQNGGILFANLADDATGPGNGAVWSGSFVGGITHTLYFSQNNNIADASSPIITGKYGGVNGGQVVDVGYQADLDGWNYSSHGYFQNLPAGTETVLVDELNRPVTIDYPFGKGRVIATLNTVEWQYAGGGGQFAQNRKVLANEIGYPTQMPTYSITGLVRDLGGNTLPGVTLSDGQGHTVTSSFIPWDPKIDKTKVPPPNYTFNEPAGTITITPSMPGYTFNPPSAQVTISNKSVTAQTITGQLATLGSYRYQGETSSKATSRNGYCGETSMAEAIQFVYPSEAIPISDIVDYMNKNYKPVIAPYFSLDQMKDALRRKWLVDARMIYGTASDPMAGIKTGVITNNHPVITAILLADIPQSADSDWKVGGDDPNLLVDGQQINRLGRYYDATGTHVLTVKGISADGLWVQVHDPFVFYNTFYWYRGGIPKGLDRYYAVVSPPTSDSKPMGFSQALKDSGSYATDPATGAHLPSAIEIVGQCPSTGCTP